MKRINGEKLIFREDFESPTRTANNGAVLSNATLASGVMTCTGGGAKYNNPNLDAFFTVGGTLRMKIKQDSGGSATEFRFFSYAKSENNSLDCAMKQSDGTMTVQIRQGAGDNYLSCVGVVAQDVDLDVVVTYSTSVLTLYVNGAVVDTESVAVSIDIVIETELRVIHVGDCTTDPWDEGTISDCEVFLGSVWTAEEVSDAYQGDTYTELDPQKSVLFVPLATRASNGSIEVSPNIGTTRTSLTCGDGTTSTTFFSATPDEWGKFDGTDYLDLADTADLDFTGGEPFTIALGVRGISATSAFSLVQKIQGDAAGMGSVGSFGYDILYRPDLSNVVQFRARSTANNTAILSGTSNIRGHALYVIATSDRTNVYIYVNGTFQSSASVSTLSDLSNTGKFRIAKGLGTPVCQMKDVQVMRRYVTATQARYMSARFFRNLKK